jgi:DNA-binding response OmpR family regulator
MANHVLIVEDDRTTRMRLAAYLREQGHRVSEAENAGDMEHIMSMDPPELLLIDINLNNIGQAPEGPSPVGEFGPWCFDRIRRRLISQARIEPLTSIEFGILKALMDHPGVTLSRARIADLLGRGDQRSNTRTIDVVVGRLRKKIEEDPAHPDWILTVHGEGYRFVQPETS